MGTGQMLLTIGAIILMGNIMVTTNRAISKSTEAMLESGYALDAVAIATSTIERAEELPFDNKTMDSTWAIWINTVDSLTSPANIGQESSSGDTLNDYDDFNGPKGQGYRLETDTLQQTGFIYNIKTTVHYVSRNLTTLRFDTVSRTSSTRTWAKQLDVYVWNVADSAGSCVHMFDIFCYWY